MRNCQNKEKNLKSNNDKTVELLNTTKSEINAESNKLALNKAHLTTSDSSLGKDNTSNLHFSLSNTNLSSSSSSKKLPLSKKKPKLKTIKL